MLGQVQMEKHEKLVMDFGFGIWKANDVFLLLPLRVWQQQTAVNA